MLGQNRFKWTLWLICSEILQHYLVLLHSNYFFLFMVRLIYQIVNHGINQNILDDALEVAKGFFELPAKEKKKFMTNDVYAPVRYSTSLKDGLDKIQFWRTFLKHYAHPLHRWIHLWPENPPAYRYQMSLIRSYIYIASTK